MSEPVRDLGTPADTFMIRERRAFSFHGVPTLDPRQLLNQRVIIAGHEYVVTGVDSFALVDVTGLAFAVTVDDAAVRP